MLLRKTVKIYWNRGRRGERLIFKCREKYYLLISFGILLGNKRRKFSSTDLISRNDNNIKIFQVDEIFVKIEKESLLLIDVGVKDLQEVLSFYERFQPTELNINDLEDAILD